jgi:hypothetical protein
MDGLEAAIGELTRMRRAMLLCVAWLVLAVVTGEMLDISALVAPMLIVHFLSFDARRGPSHRRAARWVMHAALALLALILIGARFSDLIRAEPELLALWMLSTGFAFGVVLILVGIMHATVTGAIQDAQTLAILRQGLLYDEQLAEARARDGELVGRVRERLARRTYGAALYAASEITHPDLRESVELMIKQTEERHKKEKKP